MKSSLLNQLPPNRLATLIHSAQQRAVSLLQVIYHYLQLKMEEMLQLAADEGGGGKED